MIRDAIDDLAEERSLHGSSVVGGRTLFVIALGLLFGAAGCLHEPQHQCDDSEDEVFGRTDALAHPGRWIPEQVGPYVAYDDAPDWNGGANCSATFTAGAQELRAFLMAEFPQVSSIQGYSCRQNTANTSKTSVHGTGRALDVFIPRSGGDADNDLGDPLGNWLIEHADEVGIQYIVWDRTSWNASRSAPKHRNYGGPHPHDDHIHVEITHDAANRRTPWFDRPPSLNARFVDQGSDAEANGSGGFRVCAGHSVSFWFELENTGEVDWLDTSDYAPDQWGRAVRLGALTDTADPFIGVTRVSINHASSPSTAPGGRTIFNLRGTTPLSLGSHRTQWQLIDEARAWFGPELSIAFDVVDCMGMEPDPGPGPGPTPAPALYDSDYDGAPDDIDCDDGDGTIYPYALDICEDGVDQDCDGVDAICTPGEGPDAEIGEPELGPDGRDGVVLGGCSAAPAANRR